jgi:TonB family protein
MTADAQFQVVGPAPISANAARQQIRSLLEKVDADNGQRTIKTLSGLTPWYRDILDDELIAAWRRDDRTNLAQVIEPLADPRVAAGIIEFSWRQQREAAFIPAYAPMLGHLMERYPDSAKPFLEDLLGFTSTGQPALNLPQPVVEAVCRILVDMPDLRTWKRNALQILFHYRQDAKALLEKDLQSSDSDKTDRAGRWLSDLAKVDSAVNAQAAARAGSETSKPTAVSKPTLLTKAEPHYSEIARKLRVEGTVGLQVVIKADGTLQAVKVVRPVGYGLDENAIETAREFRFNPSMKDGKPIAVLANLDMVFRLGGIEKSKTWTTGPMVFAAAPGLSLPFVEDGAMPKPGSEVSDESVVLEFTVTAGGAVRDIHAIHGSDAAAELLAASLATWKFRPATTGETAVEATARIRFVKGQGDDDAKAPLTPPVPEGKSTELQQALENSAAVGFSEPVLLHRVDAEYSDAARAAGVKGVVELRIIVDAAGNVLNPTVITGLGSGLDQKAIEAVSQWKFTPAYKDGKPVAMSKTVEINFGLQ